MKTSAPSSDWFVASDIARAMGTHKKKIHRLAVRESWPTRQHLNRLEYQPPREIADIVISSPDFDSSTPSTPNVRFCDLVAGDDQRQIVLWREEAVRLVQAHLTGARPEGLPSVTSCSTGKEAALQLVCNHFKSERPAFHISPSSLRRWLTAYEARGLDGLVEQKRGRVGRKAYALDLDREEILHTAAGAVEHGIGGRLNVARAYRGLVSDPTVAGPARTWLHGNHASKSYVPPSVRNAIEKTVTPLARTLIQIGPKAAKLDGPYTECSYDNLPAGRAWTADDMTANVYVWTEWPNPEGFLLIRPQILAIVDIGSLMWLNVRAVMRPKGQYTKDDVWGMIGDKLDRLGLHTGPDGQVDEIAVLEGGTWQSNVVIGSKTGLDDESRFGGLRSLGVKVIHTHTPRAKIIETLFNSLQSAADNCRGFCGRDERRDCPETVRQQLAQVRAGKAHPRQFFMHFNEYVQHLAGVMQALNHERNDGKILRGLTPIDKWTTDISQLSALNSQPPFISFPDSAKWLYRSSYRVSQVTRNGIRISVGTGKFQQSYSYANPEALEPWRGARVWIWWNDNDPDSDAIIYSLKGGKPAQFICVASRTKLPDRFGASVDEHKAEATRKSLAHNLAVSQSRQLAPYLHRHPNPNPNPNQDSVPSGARAEAHVSSVVNEIGSRVTDARARADEKRESETRIRSAVRRVDLQPEDTRAVVEHPRSDQEQEPFSPEEIHNLFSGE